MILVRAGTRGVERQRRGSDAQQEATRVARRYSECASCLLLLLLLLVLLVLLQEQLNQRREAHNVVSHVGRCHNPNLKKGRDASEPSKRRSRLGGLLQRRAQINGVAVSDRRYWICSSTATCMRSRKGQNMTNKLFFSKKYAGSILSKRWPQSTV